MTIAGAELREGLRAWARTQTRTLEALQRALEIVYRERPGVHTIDELVEALLLSLARSHETRVTGQLGRLDGALARLLDDVEALRNVAAEGRSPALREADLHVLAEALTEMTNFQDYVRFFLDHNASEVESTLRGLLPSAETVPDALTATAREIPPLARSASRANQIKAWAAQILGAWREGRTLEPRGVIPVAVPWRDHPTLVAAMGRMTDAIAAFDAVRHTDPAAAARSVDDLRRAVADANETLRSFGRRFESATTGDRLPPTRPTARRPVPAPGSVAEAALADAEAVATRLARSGMNGAPPAELFDAMRFSDLVVEGGGTLGEPVSRRLPGMGLEVYALTPTDVRALPTRPPWLAARLAALIEGWQRAHLIGPGFGGELFAGLMSAPWGVNQVAQNRGVEAFLRAAAREVDEVSVTATATGRRLAIPLANGAFEYIDVLASVHYEVPRPGGLPALTFDITVHPDGTWAVSHNLPTGAIGADVPLRGTR